MARGGGEETEVVSFKQWITLKVFHNTNEQCEGKFLQLRTFSTPKRTRKDAGVAAFVAQDKKE